MGCSFWVFILIFATCAGALSAQTSVTARVGSTAVLPCDCSNVTKELSPSQSHYVEWRTSSGTVFERSGEELYQGEGYKRRVDVPKDQLLEGDCSLVLKNVRAEDEGVYKCYLVVEQRNSDNQSKCIFLQSVELSVEEITETNDNQRRDSSDEKTESRNNLSPGVIGGVIVAVISLVLLGAVVFILFKRRGRNVCRRRVRDEENVNEPGRGGHDVRDNADDNQPDHQDVILPLINLPPDPEGNGSNEESKDDVRTNSADVGLSSVNTGV